MYNILLLLENTIYCQARSLGQGYKQLWYINSWSIFHSEWMQVPGTWGTSHNAQCYQTRDLGARLGYFWIPRRDFQSLNRYFATFVLLLTYLPRNVLEIGRLCEKLSISCQFRGILNFFNVNEQINHKLIGLRRHIEPSKSFDSDYPQLPEVGQSIVFPPIWVIFG